MYSICRAQPGDASRLTEIAFAAKRHWGYPESWIEAWREDLTVTPDFIERNEVYAAVEPDGMVGFYALAESDGALELEHLWVLPEMIGKGVGRQLLRHAVDRALAMGAAKIEIVSDPSAEGFYLKAGAQKIGEAVSEIEGRERRLPRLILEFHT